MVMGMLLLSLNCHVTCPPNHNCVRCDDGDDSNVSYDEFLAIWRSKEEAGPSAPAKR
jgi:hypothetical protein